MKASIKRSIMYHYTLDLEIYDPVKTDRNNFHQYIEKANKIIDYIFDKLNNNKIKITCFVTNEFVEYFKEKCEKKIFPFHEISCHTSNHFFYNGKNEIQFLESIIENKKFLEKITRKSCFGFRAPGAYIPKNFITHLIKLNFSYDSSVIPGFQPGRNFHFFSPKSPYFPDKNNIYKCGKNQNQLIEFPLAVFPFFKVNINGFFYPYLFVPLKNYFYQKETTTYIHLQDFMNITGKKFPWDNFKSEKATLNTFNELIERYKKTDMSLKNYLNEII